jgi:hypothetical protein
VSGRLSTGVSELDADLGALGVNKVDHTLQRLNLGVLPEALGVVISGLSAAKLLTRGVITVAIAISPHPRERSGMTSVFSVSYGKESTRRKPVDSPFPLARPPSPRW